MLRRIIYSLGQGQGEGGWLTMVTELQCIDFRCLGDMPHANSSLTILGSLCWGGRPIKAEEANVVRVGPAQVVLLEARVVSNLDSLSNGLGTPCSQWLLLYWAAGERLVMLRVSPCRSTNDIALHTISILIGSMF